MKFKHLLDIRLNLFDGGAAAGGDSAGAAASGQAGDGTKGDSQAAIPGSTRRGKNTGEFSNVLFGKQETPAAAGDGSDTGAGQAQPSDAGKGKEGDVTVTSNTLEEKRKAFQELVNSEYKDVYTQETQRIIDRRFREVKNLEDQVSRNQPVLDMLMQRYKIADGDMSKLSAAIENDDAYWSEAADEAGMNVEQYKQFQKLQRENSALLRAQRQQQTAQAQERQLQQWYGEAEQMKGQYPGFDLVTEVKNPQFLSMLKAGVPVQHAYEVIHMDDIKAGVAQSAARQTEKQVVDGIRAKGARPQENGTASQSAFTVKDDPSKWSKKDRAEVVRKVARGETIKL
ncbi:MAG: hypothetical protein VB071_11880 [Lawsonibacter sp.]|nr:hypothetical protein [Lawsonibacter sp.]